MSFHIFADDNKFSVEMNKKTLKPAVKRNEWNNFKTSDNG